MIDADKVSDNELFKGYRDFIERYFDYSLSGKEYRDFIKYCLAEQEAGREVNFNPYTMCAWCLAITVGEVYERLMKN